MQLPSPSALLTQHAHTFAQWITFKWKLYSKYWGVSACLGGLCLPRGCLPRWVSAQGDVSAWGCLPRGVYTTPLVHTITDRCKNITFPQLLLRTVNISLKCDIFILSCYCVTTLGTNAIVSDSGYLEDYKN